VYEARLKRNLRPVIEAQGYQLISNTTVLESISVRHIWNVERGLATMTVQMLEKVADEIGVDFLEFFRE
jgi:transcriptional regulator with XRE-family HTH domain